MTGTLWITGAAGFTGRHLIDHLRALTDRPRLVGLDLVADAPAGLDAYHPVDLNDPAALGGLLHREPPAWIIHLAALAPPATEERMWPANVGTTACLIQALREADRREVRLLCVGSAAEYSPRAPVPLQEDAECGGATLYGRIKWVQTALVQYAAREESMAVMLVRPFNLIGPGLPDRLVAGSLVRQIVRLRADEELVVGNIETARDFVDVRDAVAAYWMVVRQGRPGEIYNVCSGRPTTIRRLIEVAFEVAGLSPRLRVDPARFRAGDVPVSWGDARKLADLCGWRPTIDLRTSLADMVAFERGRR